MILESADRGERIVCAYVFPNRTTWQAIADNPHTPTHGRSHVDAPTGENSGLDSTEPRTPKEGRGAKRTDGSSKQTAGGDTSSHE